MSLAPARAGLGVASPLGYYGSAQGQAGVVLRLALHDIIKGHTATNGGRTLVGCGCREDPPSILTAPAVGFLGQPLCSRQLESPVLPCSYFYYALAYGNCDAGNYHRCRY